MAQESRLTITLDTRSAEQGAKDLTLALNAMEAAGIRVAAMSDRVNGSMAGVSHATLSSAASAAVMDRVLKTALSSFSAMDLIEMAEQWDSYAERMAVATQSLGEYDQAQARVAQLAQATSRPIDETREAFIALSPALREIGLGFDQSMDAVGAFSGLLATNGASADSGAVAMEAFANSFRTGAVNASDWAQITGTVDSLISHMADSTGKTTAEIDQLGRSGQMSAQMLAQGLASSYIPALQQLELMPKTVSGALTNLNSAFSEYVGNTNNSLQATTLLASGINFISQNFESFADVLGTVALGALGVYTSRTIGAVAATVSATVASHTKAAATLAAARAEAQAAAAALASARASLGLTTTLAQLTTAKNASEAASRRLAVAQAATAGVGRTLLGVLGGPVGLLATIGMTAASFFTMDGASDRAKVATDALTGSAQDASTAFGNLGVLSRQAALDSLAVLLDTQMGAASKAMADFVDKLDPTTKKGGAAVARMRAEMRNELTFLVGNVSSAGGDLEQAIDGLIGKWTEQGVITESQAGRYRTLAIAMVKSRDEATQTGQRWEALSELGRQLGLAAHGAAGGVQTLNNALGFSENASKQLEQIQSRIKSLQDGDDPVKKMTRWISENKDASEEERTALMSAAYAEKALLQARQATGGATKGAVSSANTLLQSLRDQVAVLGMTDAQLQRYRLQMAGASKGQMDEVEALQATKKAYEDTERANKLYQKAMLEQKSIAEENIIFQTQKNQENVGLGIGERRRKQLAEEYQITADFERRRRALEAGQEDESTRLDEPLYLQSIESLRSAEEEKLAIVRRSVQERSLLEQDWGLAMQEAMINYADNTANVYQAVSGLVGNIFKGMEDALFQFAMKGKMDFASLADSIIADMIRIAIQQSVTAPLAGMIGNLFGGGVNGVSTASAIQQGGGDGIGALISLNGWGTGNFSGGGYTGDGGRYEPAGIVHRGEGVLSQDDMRSLGGRSGFDRLRRSLRGYANGGAVGYPALPSATATASMPGQDLQVVVNNYGGNRVEAKEEMSPGADGQMLRRVVISILDEQLGSPSTSTGRVLQRGWGLRART